MSFFKGIRKGMERFGLDIATLVNTIFLIPVYFIGVGFTSMLARITGKRFLELKLNKKMKSYYNNLNIKKRPLDEYYRQF